MCAPLVAAPAVRNRNSETPPTLRSSAIGEVLNGSVQVAVFRA
jgi:hypothetical protein